MDIDSFVRINRSCVEKMDCVWFEQVVAWLWGEYENVGKHTTIEYQKGLHTIH